MEDQSQSIPRIVQLAHQIELDIQSRDLQPGDPYLTTAQTARMLGISTTIANRALQFLARNGRLDRKQRRGTFIAEPTPRPGESSLARVHLVVHQRYMRAEGLLADGVIVGLQTVLPGVDVSFNFMPPGDERQYVEELAGSIMQAGQPEGLVLVRANLEVQQMVAQSGLPAVVYGTPYRSITQLPFVDADQNAIGRLLAEYAVRQRCKRMFVIMRDQMLPGDTPYLDAIQRMAGEAGIAADRLQIRFLARDRELVAAEVRHLLERDRDLGPQSSVATNHWRMPFSKSLTAWESVLVKMWLWLSPRSTVEATRHHPPSPTPNTSTHQFRSANTWAGSSQLALFTEERAN